MHFEANLSIMHQEVAVIDGITLWLWYRFRRWDFDFSGIWDFAVIFRLLLEGDLDDWVTKQRRFRRKESKYFEDWSRGFIECLEFMESISINYFSALLIILIV